MKSSRSDDELRRQSPAYQPEAEWEAPEPQAMQVVMSARFDADSARRLANVARERGMSPSALMRKWTLQRLTSEAFGEEHRPATVHETASPYGLVPDQFEELRHKYRPDRIDLLLIGESRPAGGTFFYLANSNLFYATHEAFQRAVGPMPTGADFLRYLTERGVWLYDIVDQPVDRMPGRPRHSAVRARTSELVLVLREASPRQIVAIKRDLASTVRLAMGDAGLPVERLTVLPFPLYQWRSQYIRGLAALIRGTEDSGGSASPPHQTDAASSAGGARELPSAKALLDGLVGAPLRTMTGSPNEILRVTGDRVIVATQRSPLGKPVSIEEVQDALDLLERDGEVLVDVPTVGHRSAFIGAVLSALPGVQTSVNPRRIRLS